MRAMWSHQPAGRPVIVTTLGNRAWLEARGVDRVVELDWWQAGTIGEAEIGIPEQPIPGRAHIDVFSTSHPDTDRWYTSHDLDLQWKTLGKKVKQVFVGVDPRPDGSTRTELAADATSYAFTAPSAGLWYGHVRVIFEDGTSKTAHLRYQIDDEAPEPFYVMAQQTLVSSAVPNIVRFGTRDALSGVVAYAVYANGTFITTTTQPFAPFMAKEKGDLSIEVLAFDAAGNVTSAQTVVQIAEPEKRIPFQAPRNYILYVYAVAASLLAFLLLLVFKNVRKLKHL